MYWKSCKLRPENTHDPTGGARLFAKPVRSQNGAQALQKIKEYRERREGAEKREEGEEGKKRERESVYCWDESKLCDIFNFGDYSRRCRLKIGMIADEQT